MNSIMINTLASNKTVQRAVVSAMFNGCERNSDLFEYLADEEYPENIFAMIYGYTLDDSILLDNAKSIEEEKIVFDRIDTNCLFNNPDLIDTLIDAVKEKVFASIGV